MIFTVNQNVGNAEYKQHSCVLWGHWLDTDSFMIKIR